MKKLFTTVLSITAMGALAVTANAQETETETDLFEDRSEDAVIANDVISLVADTEYEASDVALSEILGETQDFETYVALLDLGVAIRDMNAETIIEENYTSMDAIIAESGENVEIETFLLQEDQLFPNVYGNSETDELIMYEEGVAQESSLTESIGDVNEIFYYRYEDLESLILELEEYATIYENDEHYIVTVESDEDEVEEIINQKESFEFEGIDEETKTFGLISLVNKESGLLTHTGMFADAFNADESGRITVEVGVIFEAFDEYETVEEFREVNEISYDEAAPTDDVETDGVETDDLEEDVETEEDAEEETEVEEEEDSEE